MINEPHRISNRSELLRIYAIAIENQALLIPSKKGMSGCDLFWQHYQGFSLVVSDVTNDPISSIEAIREYESVVQLLHDALNILPMRYGTVVAASQIPKLLSERQEDFQRTLSRVSGCSEMLLRWTLPHEEESSSLAEPTGQTTIEETPIVKPATGADYLKSKFRAAMHKKRRDSLVSDAKEKVEKMLGNFVQCLQVKVMDLNNANVVAAAVQDQPILAADLLVKKAEFVEAFNIAKSIELWGNPPIVARGPLPIYSFA